MKLPISKESFTPPPSFQLDYWYSEYERLRRSQMEIFVEAARWGYNKACEDFQKEIEQQ